MSSVIVSYRGSTALVSLNRVKALNALNVEMIRLLAPVSELRSPVAVLLRGEGGKAFCAGGDVRSIWENRGKPEQIDFFREEYKVDFELARHANQVCPHVALWDGVVMGGGVGISIHAPFRVATGKTIFSMPETALGIFPDVGSSMVLPRLGLGSWWGMYLGLTGARLLGADALHGGLATHFVPEDRVDSLMEALAELDAPSANAAPHPFTAKMELVRRVLDFHATPPASLPPFTYSPSALSTLASAFDPCAARSVAGVRERLVRAEGQGGEGGKTAREAGLTLDKMSPVGLQVTWEAQVRGSAQSASLGSVLAMELRVMANLLRASHGDFYEGVRAVLLDKGKGPPPSWGRALEKKDLLGLFEGGEQVNGECELRTLASHLH